jgi:hypothetical protein
MELTCEDPGALSAPSCRLTRFREFVPNDRIWIYPCFCQELLRPGNNIQIATPGICRGPRFVPRQKRAWPGANRAKTRPIRNSGFDSSGGTPTDRAFLGSPIAMCPVAQKKIARHGPCTNSAQDLNRPVLHAAGDTFTRAAFLVMSRGDQFFFAEAVVSITGREKSDASNLGLI